MIQLMDATTLIEIYNLSLHFRFVAEFSESLAAQPIIKNEYTVCLDKSCYAQFVKGVLNDDTDDLIRVYVMPQDQVKAHRRKRNAGGRGLHAELHYTSAIWYNLLSRIYRAMYSVVFDELPLYINYQIWPVQEVLRDRFSQPWLSSEKMESLKKHEMMSKKKYGLNGNTYDIYVDQFVVPTLTGYTSTFWKAPHGHHVQPRPGSGFLEISGKPAEAFKLQA